MYVKIVLTLCATVITFNCDYHISKQFGCCGAEAMQLRASSDGSKAQFDSLLREAINDMRNVLTTRTQKFDEFFRELLKSSKRDFHQMFLQTYGLLYERHSAIFTDMFQDLERYYSTGGVDLSEALDTFFHRLYQKMFQVLNSQYKFDDKYLGCISEHMDELKPFGDVPKKLTIEIKRSFIATRTFVQALSNGKDVIRNILEMPISSDCSKALTLMTYCPQCQGSTDLKPCANYCISIMKVCLAFHAELEKEWNNYVDALLLLATRLETSFNIESVVDPIDIKISEAIMNFQENGVQVSQKLFEACGKPKVESKRETRDVKPDEPFKFAQQPYVSSPTTPPATNMDRLIEDIKKKVKRTKGFWTKLPQTICSHQELAGPTPSLDCFNGSGNALYEMDTISGGVTNQNNGDSNLDVYRHNAIINQQILTLKLITNKLNHAYNGLDVEWQDNDDNSGDIENSGSGSGSGDGDDNDYSPHHINPNIVHTDDLYFGPSTQRTPFMTDNTDRNSVHKFMPKPSKPNDYSYSSKDSSTVLSMSSLLWTLVILVYVLYSRRKL